MRTFPLNLKTASYCNWVLNYQCSPAELQRKYFQGECELVRAIQKLEQENPDDHEPVKNNPALLNIVNAYRQNIHDKNGVHRFLLKISRKAKRRIPLIFPMLRQSGSTPFGYVPKPLVL